MQTIEKKEYHFTNDLGDAELAVYEVFPGVQLVYSSVHMDRFDFGNVMEGNMIEIHHCREGRIEQEFEDEFFYLMPGDFCIALRKTMVRSFRFPLRHYHGITIGIREDVAKQWLSRFIRCKCDKYRRIVYYKKQSVPFDGALCLGYIRKILIQDYFVNSDKT